MNASLCQMTNQQHQTDSINQLSKVALALKQIALLNLKFSKRSNRSINHPSKFNKFLMNM